MQLLAGKVIIVTGASRGIGAAAAVALGEAGATVVLAARDGAAAREVAGNIPGGRADVHVCDVSDYASVQRMVAETTKSHGRIDALINNAGVLTPIARLAEADPEEWARDIQINVVGAFNAIRAVLPGMITAGGGTIVNLSSGAALRPVQGWSAYCTAKAALHMMTRAVALETSEQNIRVFGFQPGMTDTNMHVLNRASQMNAISQVKREDLFPVEHPARAIVYLCTPAADDLHGQDFSLRDNAFRTRLNLEPV
jgi:NAD(P)-dependent dehydrogenase (short-subunit alcohol dehydrogenase family)